jgi:tetratricopeptide (TPR) repeat protein
MKNLFAFLLLITPSMLFAQEANTIEGNKIEVIETVLERNSHPLKQAEVEEMNAVTALIENNEKNAALQKLKPIIYKCKSRNKDSDKQIIYAETLEEFLEYVATSEKKKNIEWVIDYCPNAYNTAAFLYVALGDKDKAFEHLDLAIALAPLWAEPHNERGYLHGKLKDFPSALVSYKKAVDLADNYKSSAYVKPIALRGMGFILIEMGELERAKKIFEESLVLEPNNKLAENELEYIRQLQAKK